MAVGVRNVLYSTEFRSATGPIQNPIQSVPAVLWSSPLYSTQRRGANGEAMLLFSLMSTWLTDQWIKQRDKFIFPAFPPKFYGLILNYIHIQWLLIYICIQEVLSWNIGRNTGYPDW
jgi:hypothetical protein